MSGRHVKTLSWNDMKYSIKHLLKITLFICITCAIFQRPLREIPWGDIGYGFISSFYWLFYLFYSEEFIEDINPNSYKGLGAAIGAISQAFVAISSFVIAVITAIESKNHQ